MKNYQKVVQGGRDEVREYGFIEMTLRIALITVLLFIAALIEGKEQKGPFYIQLFRQRLSQKLCTRQSRKVIWDMINTLVVDTVAVESTFVTFV